ncbi:4-hydroxybutyrate--acetyl-CoA CoA transferase [Fusibacter paucivorans]|uniref:4-hydroxybutyrate--acetyl-CoA CoA transferase n=1 Tax=Fusibacter paucivorans TaxID=76009 RepID=A0ABS5PQ26_9FIRM|nr:acetyl-CoA hydrolase/transferase C-terminal domain-containing protein [Fusibacter paucivorans]MBS7527279.1 4-hydroxybutyrate--acetyl-CoA CoA transferase [Fusibacter paucivorans]
MAKSKFITVEEALGMIKSGDHVVSGLAGAEPKLLMESLHSIHTNVKDVRVMTCLPMGVYPYYDDPQYRESFLMEGWFYSGPMRKRHRDKTVTFIPNHLHFAAKKRIDYHKPNVYVGNCSPIDKHGYISLGLSAVYEREMIEMADIVILEINPNVPRTFGDTLLHASEVDYFIETDYAMPELPAAAPNEKDKKIGEHIAAYIEDGSTLQLGIGGIPNAVAQALMSKKDLGIHTEMFTDGMVDLYNAGAVTNAQKSLLPGKMVAAFALGSKKLYDFIDDNPAVAIMRGAYVNDPYVIGQNDKMISINTSVEVDLTGQCCSESIGSKQISGTGGQADTAIGAQNAEGGMSFIALYATAKVKDPKTGEFIEKSKIVPTLAPGAIVSLSRNDVDFVVTEYGVAALRGTSVRERVKRLIAIAHPNFREELAKEAEALMLW